MTRETLAEIAPATPLVAVQGVTKIFGAETFGTRTRRAREQSRVVALDAVSLAVPEKAFFTLLGPSGCGKTTLLRMLAGFEHPDSGDILIEGASVLAAPPNRRPVNIVFQSYALFPHMSVAENVGFGLARQGAPRATIARRVQAMLELVHLETLAHRRPAELSGGQQQRVALARALAPAPKLLLLDEPMSALDHKLRRDMQIELKRLQRDTGITFLLVTHDQEEALALSDIVAVMETGRVEQIGTPSDVYRRPASRFVADFFGANVLPGAVAGHAAEHVALRPEHVEVLSHGGGTRSGTVTALAFQGASTAVTMRLADGSSLAALVPAPPAGLRIGDTVACRWAADAIVPLER